MPADQRSSFRAQHFPHEPSLRFEVAVVPDEARAAVAPMGGGLIGLGASLAMDLPVSAGGTMAFSRIGHVEVPFASGTAPPRRLLDGGLCRWGLFMPFRDATSGTETYAAGRYLLDSAKSADLGGDPGRGTLILDFNFAFQPSCAFDPKWACPLAPPENHLDIPIRAGERLG